MITGPGIARQGNPVAGGGEVTSGTHVAVPGIGHRHGLRAGRPAEPGTPIEIDVRGKARPPRCARSRCTRKET